MRALVLLSLIVLCGLGAPRSANAASLVIEVDSGNVLYQDEATRRWYPASLTKMMTAYLVFEALERGPLKLDSKLKVSKQAAAQPPSKLGLAAGSTISLQDAVKALVAFMDQFEKKEG